MLSAGTVMETHGAKRKFYSVLARYVIYLRTFETPREISETSRVLIFTEQIMNLV